MSALHWVSTMYWLGSKLTLRAALGGRHYSYPTVPVANTEIRKVNNLAGSWF